MKRFIQTSIKAFVNESKLYFEDPLTDGYNKILVNNEVVGYIILSPAKKEYYWINWINFKGLNPLAIVDLKIYKQFRGKNYMTDTMNWLEDFAKLNEHDSIFLRVDDSSEISQESLIQIYERFGYSPFETLEDEDIFMYKLLK